MKTLKLTKKYQTYPEYKNSGVDWLGEIPNEWRVGKVKEFFRLIKDKSFNNSEDDILSLTLQGIKVRNVSNNEGQIASSYEGYRKVLKEDIVLNPMDLIRGFVDASKFEGIISPAYSTLRKNNKEINSQFYNYFFQKHYNEKIFQPFGNGVSVDHRWTLKDETLLNFPLLIIPSNEQQKIAGFLDKKTVLIDQIIEKKKKQIELLKEKRTAVINQAVTKGLDLGVEMVDSGIEWIGKIPKNWRLEKIKHLIKTMEAGIWGENPAGNDDDVKCLRVADFDYDNLTFSNVETIRNNNNLPKRKVLQEGDILIEKSGGGEKTPVGRSILFNSNEKMVCANFIEIVRVVEEKTLPEFLVFYLSILYSKRLNVKYIKQNTGIQNIDIKEYFQEIIALPDIEIQKDIIEKIKNKINIYKNTVFQVEKSIELLQEFKSSLITNTVTGKIKI